MVPSSIHRRCRRPDRESPRCGGEENRVTNLPYPLEFRGAHPRSKSTGNSCVQPWPYPSPLASRLRASRRPRTPALPSNMQSDWDCDNYTNSELRLKSEIAKNDECISKLLLAHYRIATSSISYSTPRSFMRRRTL